MTLLDGGGGGGGPTAGNGEVSTLSRPIFHRTANGSAKKHHISPTSSFNSDINANNTSITNENFENGRSSSGNGGGGSSGVRRVPEMCTSNVQQPNDRENDHDLKKWSDLCKMNGFKRPESSSNATTAAPPTANNGDNNNNHSEDNASAGPVLPDMDFSN